MDFILQAVNAPLPGAPTYLDKLSVPLAYLPWTIAVTILLLVVLGLLMLCINRWLTPGYNIGSSIRGNPVAVALFWGLILAAFIATLGGFFGRAAFGATDRYDGEFRRWGLHYFGERFDWREWKAQAMTESALRPRAISPVGACGLMQHMPATAAELGIDCYDPRQAIEGGVRYMAWQVERWTAPRPDPERLALAKASYNAGLGNILRFQRDAARVGGCDANRYLCVEPHLWVEPQGYVRRIARWCLRFNGWGCWPINRGE
jgi:membrane-bound lytic murein transglycosylase F